MDSAGTQPHVLPSRSGRPIGSHRALGPFRVVGDVAPTRTNFIRIALQNEGSVE